MISRIVVCSTLVLAWATPALAGPCTQRVLELEKSVTAKLEGAGPALSPAVGSSETTGRAPSVKREADETHQIMQMLQQAKALDQQGKEAECMQVVGQVDAKAPKTK
ncbi:MAG TPA: hypothetical protein VGD36_03750 [Xanthobacteraceae bacterium]|jgi:hypothetical protein